MTALITTKQHLLHPLTIPEKSPVNLPTILSWKEIAVSVNLLAVGILLLNPFLTLLGAAIFYTLTGYFKIRKMRALTPTQNAPPHRTLTPTLQPPSPKNPPPFTNFPQTVEDTGLVIGGSNPTSKIRALQTINGYTIAKLEKGMRPSDSLFKDSRYPYGYYEASTLGFLTQDQRLLEVMALDNDKVLHYGLTHSQIAYPLFLALKTLEELPHQGSDRIGEWEKFSCMGQNYEVRIDPTMSGDQKSPFFDGTNCHCRIVIVRNRTTGEQFTFSGLLPEMIVRYGFYEGEGTHFRQDPEKIMRFFKL